MHFYFGRVVRVAACSSFVFLAVSSPLSGGVRARDSAHDLTEANLQDSQVVDFFRSWTADARARYVQKTSEKPDLRLSDFFAMDTLQWNDMQCTLDHGGCINQPGLDVVLAKYPDKSHARQVWFTIQLLDLLYKQASIVGKALFHSRTSMSWQCDALGDHFFHKLTSPPYSCLIDKRANPFTSKFHSPLRPDYVMDLNGEGDDAAFELDIEVFKDDTRDECGTTVYSGKKQGNKDACRFLIASVTQYFRDKVEKFATTVVCPEVLAAPSQWPENAPAPLADLLEKRLGSWSAIDKLLQRSRGVAPMETSIVKALMANIVTNVWTGSKCFMMCKETTSTDRDRCHPPFWTGDTACMPVCWEPIEWKPEALRGFNDDTAEEPLWLFTQQAVFEQSWAAYQANNTLLYRPSTFDVNPLTAPTIKDSAPVLPVCHGAYAGLVDGEPCATASQFPCSCGDKYGSESDQFFSAYHWRTMRRVDHAVHACRHGPLVWQKMANPGAYLVNLCRLYFGVVHPPESEQAQLSEAH